MANVTFLSLAAGVFLVGVGITALGLAALRQWLTLARRSAADIHEVREGPTELSGTAEVHEPYGTVRSGLTGETCLLYEYEAEKYEQSGQHGGSWNEVVSGSDGVPFAVGDGTGRVLVDPDGATTVLEHEYEERLDPGDEPSETAASFFARSDVDRDTRTIDIGITELQFGDQQRFRERRIHAGEEVYVAGVADRDVGDFDVEFGGPDLVVRSHRSDSRVRRYLEYPFVISDRSEAAAERWLLKRAAGVLAVGLPVTVLAGYLLVSLLP